MRLEKYLTETEREDVVDIGSRSIFKHAGVTLTDTYHGVQRIQQRNELTMEQLKKLFTSAIDKFKRLKTYVGEKIVFYSKSLKQAFIAAVDGKKDMTLVTFYPRKAHPSSFTHPENVDVVLEGIEYRYVELP